MARIQLPADFGWLPNSRWQLWCSGATWCVSLFFFFFTAQLGHFFGSFTTVPVPSGGYVKNRESPGQIDRGGRYVLVILLLPATVNFPDNIDLCMHNKRVCKAYTFALFTHSRAQTPSSHFCWLFVRTPLWTQLLPLWTQLLVNTACKSGYEEDNWEAA